MVLNTVGDFWGKLKPQYDDDVIDRLNYIYTNIIILAFALTVGAKQYVGEPLQCWVPAQFKGGWEQYVENYCFVENTYWLDMNSDIPDDKGEREGRELQYYQWVPFVLAFQALLFYLPRMLWKMLNFHTGLNITALIQTAMLTKKDGDKKILKGADVEAPLIAEHFRAAVTYRKDGLDHGNALSRAMSRGWGVYVTVLYLVIKLLFIVNVIVQFIILNNFLGPQYTWWGYDILKDLANGREWEQSGHFPRVTMCDVEVRQLGNLHTWSIQCVLMINMFNEKIYLFLWWWFLIVAVLTTINFFYWLVISFVPSFSHDFINRYLRYKGIRLGSPRSLERFVDDSLHKDGVTVLRLISDNCGDLVTAEIVNHLWNINQGNVNNSATGANVKPSLANEMDDEKVRLVDSDTSHDKSNEFHERE
jgi:hypothetical protein